MSVGARFSFQFNQQNYFINEALNLQSKHKNHLIHNGEMRWWWFSVRIFPPNDEMMRQRRKENGKWNREDNGFSLIRPHFLWNWYTAGEMLCCTANEQKLNCITISSVNSNKSQSNLPFPTQPSTAHRSIRREQLQNSIYFQFCSSFFSSVL